jgi:peptidyl-prolyl cis-trans isomerase B (cyclophilin B)
VLLVCLLAAGCGSAKSSDEGTTRTTPPATGTATETTPTTAVPPSTPAGCRSVEKPKGRKPPHLPPPSIHLDPAKTYTVTVATSCGKFAIRLDVKRAPLTTASFYSLVKRGFYDGLDFHRIAQGFVIQGGDPLGTGGGGPGYQITEPPPRSLHYTRGTVAMAKTGDEPSGRSGSQFFVVTAEDATAAAGLTPDYALVGQVTSGLKTVHRIELTPTNPPGDGEPQDPIVIEKMTVAEK